MRMKELEQQLGNGEAATNLMNQMINAVFTEQADNLTDIGEVVMGIGQNAEFHGTTVLVRRLVVLAPIR